MDVLKIIFIKLKIIIFIIFPLHLISRITFFITRIENDFIKNLLIDLFLKLYDINLDECKETNLKKYKSLNDFFTRELNLKYRPLSKTTLPISPADGIIQGYGKATKGKLLHVKGVNFDINKLINSNSKEFESCFFINIYLTPSDCHRVYSPDNLELKKITHVPGNLYSVAPYVVHEINGLFEKNERVILNLENRNFKSRLVMVGAVNVGCISLKNYGLICPTNKRISEITTGGSRNVDKYKKGEELGMFNLGSTVILLMKTNKEVAWSSNIKIGAKIKFKQKMFKD